MKTKTASAEAAVDDSLEREEALTPDRSYIVQAPAGSGKTGLLVQRILRLLSVVSRPESVIAMTFTVKAAGEMRERVLNALEEAADDAPVTSDFGRRTRQLALEALARDREENWGLLTDGSRLQIQTIDALCATLVRQMPIVSESGSFGGVVEDPGELYRLAARRTLQNFAASDDTSRALFRRIAAHFDNDTARLERQIVNMLGKRDQWCIRYFEHDPSVIGDFCRLLAAAESELKQVFREENEVDFAEITRAAINALGEPEAPSELLYALDYRIEHLLVDEFQDTSKAQYQLLDALTGQWSEGDGRTLFLVGDPMQSIYRFRAAEVGLFLQAWEHEQLGSIRLHPLRLRVNFRSTPQIVDWTCSALASLMDNNNAAKGAVKFVACTAARQDRGAVPQLIPLLEDKTGEREAQEIVRLLKDIPDWSDTAILLRNRSHVAAILPALREAGIPYQAIEIDQLKGQQHILDLLALTRAVLHLADRTAWLACLRAPWCGLTLPDLAALGEKEPQRTILDLLSDPEAIAHLSPEGRLRAVRIQEVLSKAVGRVGRAGLRDLIEEAWLALGGPAILPQPNQLEDAETLFGLLESFEEGGTIRDFSLLEERLQRLYAKPNTAGNGVQVMTVHQAKGLEFDTVILPQLARWPRADEQELLICHEAVDEDGAIRLEIAALPQRGEEDPEYGRIREELKEKNKNEAKRLFYVACTRARNRLLLLGSAAAKAKGKSVAAARDGTFLRMIWDVYKPEFEQLLQTHAPAAPKGETDAVAATNTLRRLPLSWRLPQREPAVHWQPELQIETEAARRLKYEWVSGLGRHVGTVVHQILKQAAANHLRSWNDRRLSKLEPIIRSELSRLGVAPALEARAWEQIKRAVHHALSSEKGRWILSAHPEAKSGWPISGSVNGKLISGTVDRVFRDEDGRLWLIDFKISQHQGSDIETFISAEQNRHRPGMENYAALAARLAGGPIYLGLYFPLLNAWREWEFTTEATGAAH
jgi:ATP-dependent exoDNAse (exonuclease V) beta subunit